ncbi:PhzF family phenazine biosynthesis protein [Pseudoalteromonas sp. A601]|uniref:PhzF family phenazine biosynthesis protein n=1 Tax=Pseudoalteromonas sp. A601 TaxID=1967839 RepID=UPI001594BF87|nr:PhzF family phenazine biosynthesis protein [Pseudoalteromonas sp. A601]
MAQQQTVFTHPSTKKTGSSALIVLHQTGLSTYMMQQIARTSQQSATVFINVKYSTQVLCPIRWFNQSNEIKRCGHGTLAAALFLQQYQGYYPHQFISLSGEIFKITYKLKQLRLSMAQIASKEVTPHKAVVKAINSTVLRSYTSAEEGGYTTVILDDSQPLSTRSILTKPILSAPTALIVLQKDSKTQQWYFRYFAPYYGIDEDQATGSAVSIIAPIIKQLTTQNKGVIIQASKNGARLNYHLTCQSVLLY